MGNIEFFTKKPFGYTFIEGLDYLYGQQRIKLLDEIDNSPTLKFLLGYGAFGPTGYLLSQEFIEDCRKMINYGGKVLIDYTMEADTAIKPEIVYLLEKFKTYNIDLSKVILVSNNSRYLDPCRFDIRGYKLNHIFNPSLMVNSLKHISEYFTPTFEKYDPQIPSKDFLMLNRKVGPDKFMVIDELIKRGWKHRTDLTFNTFRPGFADTVRDNESYMETVKELGLTVPVTVPIQLDDDYKYGDIHSNDELLYKVKPEWYDRVKVNIIVETWYKNTISMFDAFGEMIHHTEKTFKAIAFNKPFVVTGTKGHLKVLRKFGFRTDFLGNDTVDYDSADDNIRYKLALNEADKMAKNYDNEHMKEVCLHNQKVFFDINTHKNLVTTYFLNNLKSNLI